MLHRKFMVLILLSTIASLVAPVSASDVHAGLTLRKAKYVMDDSGQVWLSVQLVNDGKKPLAILGLAPAKAGPWTSVGQNAAPGATVRSAMKVKEGGVTVLWVDSTAGILRFELPHTR